MHKRLFPFLIVLLALGTASCGYSTSSALPSSIKTIYVEDFNNEIIFTTERVRNIYFPLLEVNVRNAVIDRFLFDGNLRITEEDRANLILKGDLVGYERSALRYTDDDDVQEYRVHIIMDLQMWDVNNEEMFWEERGFAGEGTYFVTGPQTSSETAAVEEATLDIARRIVERTIENW